METVFALDAQVDDMASLLVAVTLGGTSLVLALRGSWWATAIPTAVFALGAMAYLTSEPNHSGGDSDPAGLLGVALLYIGGAWFLVALAITLLARRLS